MNILKIVIFVAGIVSMNLAMANGYRDVVLYKAKEMDLRIQGYSANIIVDPSKAHSQLETTNYSAFTPELYALKELSKKYKKNNIFIKLLNRITVGDNYLIWYKKYKKAKDPGIEEGIFVKWVDGKWSAHIDKNDVVYQCWKLKIKEKKNMGKNLVIIEK